MTSKWRNGDPVGFRHPAFHTLREAMTTHVWIAVARAVGDPLCLAAAIITLISTRVGQDGR